MHILACVQLFRGQKYVAALNWFFCFSIKSSLHMVLAYEPPLHTCISISKYCNYIENKATTVICCFWCCRRFSFILYLPSKWFSFVSNTTHLITHCIIFDMHIYTWRHFYKQLKSFVRNRLLYLFCKSFNAKAANCCLKFDWCANTKWIGWDLHVHLKSCSNLSFRFVEFNIKMHQHFYRKRSIKNAFIQFTLSSFRIHYSILFRIMIAKTNSKKEKLNKNLLNFRFNFNFNFWSKFQQKNIDKRTVRTEQNHQQNGSPVQNWVVCIVIVFITIQFLCCLNAGRRCQGLPAIGNWPLYIAHVHNIDGK